MAICPARYEGKRVFVYSILLSSALLLFTPILLSQSAKAEEVIFIVPGSSDPRSVMDFDPQIQKIEIGKSIVFVNADGLDHHLVVKSVGDNKEVFDTGVLAKNQFVSHEFSENGEYTLQCKIYSHMKGTISATDDIATFTKTIEDQNLEVQLTRSPANPGVNEEIYYKVTFIDAETGRNHPHIDFTLIFNDSSANYVDGIGGHTVDGQEVAVFKFDKEDAFTPAVQISGVNFVPVNFEPVTFDTLVTPEFSPTIVGFAIAAALGTTIAMCRRNRNDHHLP